MYKKIPYLCILPLLALPLMAQAKEGKKHAHIETPAVRESLSAVSFKPFTGKVVGTKVRLRTQPNRESPVVREFNGGEMVGILSEENDFYAMQSPKAVKGYVFRTFILDNIVEGDKVNIRLHPDTDAPIIGKLNAGEKIEGTVCTGNSKWMEISLPATTHFFIAKEYVENIGSFDMLAKNEARHEEGLHKLSSIFHFAKAELQKPFEDISFDTIRQTFDRLCTEFADIPQVLVKAKEANNLIEETYLQKKIGFLETKASEHPIVASRDVEMDQFQKLNLMGKELKGGANTPAVSSKNIGEAAASVVGQSTAANDSAILDKNSVWHSLEEANFHLWALTNEGKSMENFYEESAKEAVYLTGVVEPCTKPVKNRPGDFLLCSESSQPVAFLYSTKVNLQDFVGKKVTLVMAPRPNNNFAFPAFFVLGSE